MLSPPSRGTFSRTLRLSVIFIYLGLFVCPWNFIDRSFHFGIYVGEFVTLDTLNFVKISMEGGSERLFSWMYPMISSLWVWVCTRSVRSRATELRTRHESKLPAWAQPTITCHPSQPLFSVLFTFYRHAFWRRIIITDWETAPAQWPQIDNAFSVKCFV